MSSHIFRDVTTPCQCFPEGHGCVCEHDEKVIRTYSSNEGMPPMTPAQREWCVSQADWAAEGHYDRAELEKMNDKELAYAVLRAWNMYADSVS